MLYSGASSESGSVTLSQAAEDFARIVIMYEDTDGTFGSVAIPISGAASPMYAAMQTTVVSSLGWFIKSRTVEINGTTIATRKFGGQDMAGEIANGSSSAKSMIAIREVLGYKQ